MVARLTEEQRRARRDHVSRPATTARRWRSRRASSARRRSSSCRRPRRRSRSAGARAFGAEVIFEGTTSVGTAGAGGSRSGRARPDDGAAVRSRVDHRRPGDRGPRDPRPVPRRWPPCSCPIGGGGPGCRRRRQQSSCRDPTSRSIGVEPSGAAAMKASLDAGQRGHARPHAQHRRRPDAGASG